MIHARILAAARHIGPSIRPCDWNAVAAAMEALKHSRWPEVAWKGSRLTHDGAPVEFSFSSRDNDFRCTIDPAPPERPERDRLESILALVATYGGTSSARVVAPWRRAARNDGLHWGAWLGLRQEGRRLHPKIYIEPGQGLPFAPPDLGTGHLRMIGIDLLAGRTEYYFDLPGLERAGLEMLVGRFGGDTERESALDLLERCWGFPVAFGTQWMTLGCSLSFGGAGLLPGVALHFPARAVQGKNARIREVMLAEQAAHGVAHSAFGRMWADRPLPDHGVVTIAPHRAGGLEMRCGISGRAVAEVVDHVG